MTDSLLSKFESLAAQKQTYGLKKTHCRLTEVMRSLPPETAEYLQKIIDAPQGDPIRLSNATISNVLRSEGYDVGRTTISDHRRGYCQCFMVGTK